LVLSEGECTEPEYLEGFRRWCRNPLVSVKIAEERGVPLTLVRAAKKHRADAQKAAKREGDENHAYDEVWCVFDVDEHPYLNQALDEARTAGIEVALSNPCFELWLLLHFQDSPGPRGHKELPALLSRHIGPYDKRVRIELLWPRYEDAKRRAERLDRDANEAAEPQRNPTTGVYRLTETIRRRV